MTASTQIPNLPLFDLPQYITTAVLYGIDKGRTKADSSRDRNGRKKTNFKITKFK